MNNNYDDNHKSTYEEVKDDKNYIEYSNHRKSIGDFPIQDVQRRFNVSALTALKFKYAYQYERSMK